MQASARGSGATAAPLVTIGIPTYKRPEYLRGALSSALTQHYPHLEIVVSDNAHDPQTARVVAEFAHDPRVRYWPQPENLGMAGNWDALVEAAQGQYFLILSDDDLLLPETVGGLVGALERHPEAAFSFCSVRYVDADGREVGADQVSADLHSGPETVFAFLRGENSPFLCGTLYNLEKFKALTRFARTGCRMASDAAAWMKLALCHNAAVAVPEVSCVYRLHMHSQSGVAGVEGWKKDLEQLRLEVLAALERFGYSEAVIREAEVLFGRHSAGMVRGLILSAPRQSLRDVRERWQMLLQHRAWIVGNLGYAAFLSALLRVLPHGPFETGLRRLKAVGAGMLRRTLRGA